LASNPEVRFETGGSLPPGWLLESEQAVLTEYARDGEVLEIGTFLGRSTVVMARVARQVVTVDPHSGSPEILEALAGSDWARLLDQGGGRMDSLPACIEYLEAAHLREKIAVVVATFEQVAHLFKPSSFDLVFVDGDHSYAHCLHDGLAGLGLAKPGAPVLFHDHEASWPAVEEAVRDLARTTGQEVRRPAGALGELRGLERRDPVAVRGQ
jgi:predicted O-methyltransferase YrrM